MDGCNSLKDDGEFILTREAFSAKLSSETKLSSNDFHRNGSPLYTGTSKLSGAIRGLRGSAELDTADFVDTFVVAVNAAYTEVRRSSYIASSSLVIEESVLSS